MQVIVVGTGQLATELLTSLSARGPWPVTAWANKDAQATPAIVVHAGSGRELTAVSDFCLATRSTLIELATGSALASSEQQPFPVVLCPNTNILMLKFMSMLAQSGHLFQGQQIKLTESHQAPKTSVPGTAVSMAQSLGLPEDAICSVRDPLVQAEQLGIPSAHLARHAYHQILIEDRGCCIQLETRVYGESPYADGVARIVEAVRAHALENRLYPVMEFVNKGWI